MLVSIDTIKCFWADYERGTASRRNWKAKVGMKFSTKPYVKLADENEPSTQNPLDDAIDEDGLMELFDQFTGLMAPILD